MRGLGTLINMGAILAGGILGLLFKNLIRPRAQETVLKANGFAVIALGAAGSLSLILYVNPESGRLESHHLMLMILSLAGGAFLGELLNIEGAFRRFGDWLKEVSASSGDPQFLTAFLSASFTVCIGAMAIIGSIRDGISGDLSILEAKAVLDFVIIAVMASAMGRGCLFSAVPVGILQGSITLAARLLEPLMTEPVLSAISLVGNLLIACVGVNLIWKDTIRVANLLPALLLAGLLSPFL